MENPKNNMHKTRWTLVATLLQLYFSTLALADSSLVVPKTYCVDSTKLLDSVNGCLENDAFVNFGEQCLSNVQGEIQKNGVVLAAALNKKQDLNQTKNFASSKNDYLASIATLTYLIGLNALAGTEVDKYLDNIVLPEDVEDNFDSDSYPCYGETKKSLNSIFGDFDKNDDDLKKTLAVALANYTQSKQDEDKNANLSSSPVLPGSFKNQDLQGAKIEESTISKARALLNPVAGTAVLISGKTPASHSSGNNSGLNLGGSSISAASLTENSTTAPANNTTVPAGNSNLQSGSSGQAGLLQGATNSGSGISQSTPQANASVTADASFDGSSFRNFLQVEADGISVADAQRATASISGQGLAGKSAYGTAGISTQGKAGTQTSDRSVLGATTGNDKQTGNDGNEINPRSGGLDSFAQALLQEGKNDHDSARLGSGISRDDRSIFILVHERIVSRSRELMPKVQH